MRRLTPFILLLFCCASLGADLPYIVEFTGVNHSETEQMLRSVSQLIHLQSHPPSTTTALRRRAEADIPNLKQGLQTRAFYSPKIDLHIDTESYPARVIFDVDTGPVYPLACFSFDPVDEHPLNCISARELCLEVGRPAYPETILDAEYHLLEILATNGFPLASVTQREVIADVESHTISLVFHVDTGPAAIFGSTTIRGLKKVRPCVINYKIAWREGMPYSPECIKRTQEAIEASGLFYSVTISAGTEVDECGRLPMIIEVCESKHRTIGFGVNYNTEQGPGVTADWEYRNVRGRGEKVSFRTDLWNNRQRGSLLYFQPDILCPRQDLIWLAEVEKEKTDAFREFFFSFSGIIEWQLNDCTKISYGGMFKQLDTESSNNNGSFTLVKIPMSFRWSNSNSLLDPTSGGTVNFRLTPSFQTVNPMFTYSIGQLTHIWYRALSQDQHWVLATKLRLGAIVGATNRTIPPPERFYAGNEHTLRGYKYMTVGPIENGRPVGGRSLLVYSVELRARVAEQFGWVVFYEVGNVYKSVFPEIDRKQRQSVGYGIRYHTPVGPLRVDFAVPLNRRSIDNRFEIYFSIGQAF